MKKASGYILIFSILILLVSIIILFSESFYEDNKYDFIILEITILAFIISLPLLLFSLFMILADKTKLSSIFFIMFVLSIYVLINSPLAITKDIGELSNENNYIVEGSVEKYTFENNKIGISSLKYKGKSYNEITMYIRNFDGVEGPYILEYPSGEEYKIKNETWCKLYILPNSQKVYKTICN